MVAKLTVAGCGNAFADNRNAYSCFHFQFGETSVVLDCGATALYSLKKAGIDGSMADVIIISHFHGDHYNGLPYLILEAAIMRKRKKPLHIISPGGLKKKLRELVTMLYPGSESILDSFRINYHVFDNQKGVNVEDLRVESLGAVHKKETKPHCLRILTNDLVIAYSGDSGWTENLVKISERATLFICECNNYDVQMKSHLDFLTINKNRQRIRARHILLTHMGKEMWEKKKEAEKEGYIVAEDGRVTDLYALN